MYIAFFRNFRQSATTHWLLDSSDFVDFLGFTHDLTGLQLHQTVVDIFCYFWIWLIPTKIWVIGLKQPILGMGWNMPKTPACCSSRKAKRVDFSRNMAWVRPANWAGCVPVALLVSMPVWYWVVSVVWSYMDPCSPTGSPGLVKINASFGCRPSGGPDSRCLQHPATKQGVTALFW